MASAAPANRSGFTISELLVVIAIIIILGGLILTTFGYVQKKGARSRAAAEIAGMAAALENYKADNGIYPRDTTNNTTDNLNPRTDTDPSATVYSAASLFLYEQLAGVTSGSRSETPSRKTYFAFKPNMLVPTPPSVADITAIRDPFGKSYGYSTAYQNNPSQGYNPTYDLWSTANSSDQNQWIKNW